MNSRSRITALLTQVSGRRDLGSLIAVDHAARDLNYHRSAAVTKLFDKNKLTVACDRDDIRPIRIVHDEKG